uniref:Urocanate hydratase n=1 Tax=Plectus sambesii TaxID=2011161 RepID=A0A914XKY5_9BILA
MDITKLLSGLPVDPLPPPLGSRSSEVVHAPKRAVPLSANEKKQALRNALRYIPPALHNELASEFAQELKDYGHIYMYRFLPPFSLRAVPMEEIKTVSRQSAAIIHMLLNNLDPAVAQFPHELVTYGGNGQVLSNWAQFWLVLHYLATMTDEQTLVLYSGHPHGLFPSHKDAPRLVITNGMVIPNYSSKEFYDKFFALGVTMYGQMTAGSYCYIGPQGIVHGTTITVINAGRKYLNVEDLSGKVFVTSGLGGMSGAQAKAAVIAGCVGVIAEVSESALLKRHKQGWLEKYSSNLDDIVEMIKQHRKSKTAVSIGYLGNVVDLWERLVEECERTGELLVELGSDQTSCHNPYNGGYYPVGLSFADADAMMASDPAKFKELVQKSLCRQIAAIDALASKGLRFWDYGNAFLLECQRAGADVKQPGSDDIRFKYPSYVQDIMGDVFSMGFGPFRWVCTSGNRDDLRETDRIAAQTLKQLAQADVPEAVQQQFKDNILWIEQADGHEMVVGSQARILYSDQEGRAALALAFNQAVRSGRIT